MHHRERQTTVHAPSIYVNRACSALAVVAALLGAGEVEAFAQCVQKCGARVWVPQRVLFAVDAQSQLVDAVKRGRPRSRRFNRRSRLHQRRRARKKARRSQTREKGPAAETSLGPFRFQRLEIKRLLIGRKFVRWMLLRRGPQMFETQVG
jgi:hypothetical protein